VKYVAFLRAINVGGRVVRMEQLRAVFESLRLGNVSTFIASGNVLFESGAAPASLEKRIESALQKALGYRVDTFLRTGSELVRVADRNPFDVGPGDTFYVGFFRDAPAADARTRVLALNSDVDTLAVHGRELYWRIHGKTMDSKITPGALEKALKTPGTLRNINTVRKLALKHKA
jgi:uncharacterized protein (DUF1697 family)